MICPRCTKNTDGVHTCTPTEGWRKMEERLAELAKQEPVAWMNRRNRFICKDNKNPEYNTPLYTHAPDSAARIAELEAENAKLLDALDQVMDDIKSESYLFEGGCGISETSRELVLAALASAKGE